MRSSPAGRRAGVKHTLRKGTGVGTEDLPLGLQRYGLTGAELGELEAWEVAGKWAGPGQLTQETGLGLSPTGRP